MKNKSHFEVGKQTAYTVGRAMKLRGATGIRIIAVTPARRVIMDGGTLLRLSAEYRRAGAIVAAIYQDKGCAPGCVTERDICRERKK